MTEERPVPARRRPRPGTDFRRRALEAHAAAPDASILLVAGERASLADDLAKIPDLSPGEDVATAVAAPAGAAAVAQPVLAPEPVEAPAAEASPVPATEPVPAPAPLPESEPDAVGPLGATPDDELTRALAAAVAAAEAERAALQAPPAPTGRQPVPMAVLATAIALLVIAVPVLGVIGFRIVGNSTDGTFTGSGPGPKDPGYEAAVEPTPTAVFIQHDATGKPVAATYLSLSGADGGGSVIFVPLGTKLRKPALGIDRLSKAYDTFSKEPATGRQVMATQITHLLNAGADDVIEVDDAGWAQMVKPVGAVSFTNPDNLTINGTPLPAGPVTLQPEQVGPYLAAELDGESDLNRLNRHQVFWTAWLAAIKANGTEAAIPGESTAGIGLFTKTLSNGVVSYDTLPVTPNRLDPTLLEPDVAALNALVTRAVPAPVAAYFDSRKSVRLLNGVSADPIPDDVLSTIVSRNGEIAAVGNGPSFGQTTTTIIYADPAQRNYARMLKAAFGGTAVLRLDREAPDNLDVTVVLGQDALTFVANSATSTTSAVPTSTAPTSTPTGN